jgi:hypothetical protein
MAWTKKARVSVIEIKAWKCQCCGEICEDKEYVEFHEPICFSVEKQWEEEDFVEELTRWKPEVTIDRRTIARQERESEGG